MRKEDTPRNGHIGFGVSRVSDIMNYGYERVTVQSGAVAINSNYTRYNINCNMVLDYLVYIWLNATARCEGISVPSKNSLP